MLIFYPETLLDLCIISKIVLWASLVAQLGTESTCNAGALGLILGLGRSPGEGNGYPLQYSGLEKSMDYIVHGVAKSYKRLNDLLVFPTFFNLSLNFAIRNP